MTNKLLANFLGICMFTAGFLFALIMFIPLITANAWDNWRNRN